jgi:broad specificity phosphatase PhoE
MTRRPSIACTCLALLLSACAGTPAPRPADDGVTFMLVRHAEKADDDPRDPSLSEAGQSRAQQLAMRLRGERLVAAYATQYRRTQQTVAPVATAQGLAVTPYDAASPADDFAGALLDAHRNGMVLVAGHSNTVPGIVAALCRCATEPMPETEYDRISIVRIDAAGHRSLHLERYAPGVAANDAP